MCYLRWLLGSKAQAWICFFVLFYYFYYYYFLQKVWIYSYYRVVDPGWVDPDQDPTLKKVDRFFLSQYKSQCNVNISTFNNSNLVQKKLQEMFDYIGILNLNVETGSDQIIRIRPTKNLCSVKHCGALFNMFSRPIFSIFTFFTKSLFLFVHSPFFFNSYFITLFGWNGCNLI